ncbi:complex I subunit 5 family protein [Thiohalorhabdus denitrificans]|uniref:Formate hydrogenlyase subunit 3/Multisubunit Na+/H+ antiporter, MnhD subunit n=1 Tax=Thiohalorhabdus denitrificans TaxID=381306 RepID=A0A1G5FIF3_9GAMM|nr:complex I subunit 5 family protein [Thiohalorhabdus denitrificans]SCY39026.1 Formate hydrogenlyase subunit 3/Multisubunit Na+/H+ antiporter, MnhD subunit [Thiohalorhabdus denitrificans]
MTPLADLAPARAEALLALAWLAPLAGLATLALSGRRALALAPLWGLPGLAAALLLPDGAALQLPWVLTGIRLEMDPVGRVFLLLAAFLWTAAAGFARGYLDGKPGTRRFLGFYLLCMAGNLGLTVAQDPPAFLAFFSLMGLSAYGLIIHTGTPFTRRAANVYLGAAVTGEMAVLAGLLFTVGGGLGSPWWEVLLVVGLGVKAGLLPLHFWLPLAHPAAPSPASAVLSGTMIKAGLLGWLRFLPLGEAALPGLGAYLMAMGLAGAFLMVAVGLPQRDPKTVLAYSSISQMGWLAGAVGVGLAAPAAWGALLPAVLAYALHHGLAKGALFLSTGLQGARYPGRAARAALGAAFVLPALTIAGLPGTSGAAAKTGLKEALKEAPGLAAVPFELLLGLGAAATTLLMARFLFLLGRAEPQAPPGGWLLGPWLATVAASLALTWVWGPLRAWQLKTLAPAELVGALWPVTAGALLALAGAGVARRWGPLPTGTVPAGDLYVAAAAGLRWLRGRTTGARAALFRLGRAMDGTWATLYAMTWRPWRRRILATDRWGWGTSGTAFLLLMGAVAWAVLASLYGS